MPNFSERLKAQRKALGLSQDALAEKCAISARSQRNYESGERSPDAVYLAALANTGVDVNYVLTGIDANATKRLAILGQAISTAGEHVDGFQNTKLLGTALNSQMLASDYVLVPRHDVRASAGNGAMIHDESIIDHLAFKREWITKSLGCSPEAICVIEVRGDSMVPTLNEADLLLLDMRTVTQRVEGVYVIQLQGSLLVKRLRFKLNGTVDVISDNQRYGTETLTAKEADQLTVLGRVVWHGCKF